MKLASASPLTVSISKDRVSPVIFNAPLKSSIFVIKEEPPFIRESKYSPVVCKSSVTET